MFTLHDLKRLWVLIGGISLFFWSTASFAQEDDEVITDLSETQTSYAGARLLNRRENITLGELTYGRHEDTEDRDRFIFWQGDSLFLGVIDTEAQNRLDVVAEFYWFESSLPRNSDFYVIVLKVTAAPAANTNWRIATPGSLFDGLLFRDIGAVQRVEASMDLSGESGAIRWDWSVPFQNYRWEPERVIEIEQEYAAGARVEGSAMRDLSGAVNVQAKGFLNAETKVSTRYTITLWRWEMLVQAGATNMDWALIALDPEHEQDPAYHEYFLVLQSERGVPVRLDHLQFSTTMRKRDLLWLDEFSKISIRLRNIELSAPQNPCDEGFTLQGGECVSICSSEERWDGVRCAPVCPDGYEAQGDTCLEICPESFEFVDGVCQLLCPPNEIAVGGICEFLCEDGQISIERQCAEPMCPEGERREGEDCVSLCAPDQQWDEGVCIDRCPEGFRSEGDLCVPQYEEGFSFDGMSCVSFCPENTRYVEGRCELEQQCEAGTILEGAQCVSICPESFVYRDGRCQSLCSGESVWIEGECLEPCPEGSERRDGECTNTNCEEDDCEEAAVSETPKGCATRHSSSSTLFFLLWVCSVMRRRRSGLSPG